MLLAQRRIRPFLSRTPLIRSDHLSQRIRGEVWLKLESRQPTGSFKVRGALSKLAAVEDPEREFVTGSAGNHGLGVAFAAYCLGMKNTTIFIPESAPDAKKRRLERFNIDLRNEGQTYDDAHQAAVDFASERGALYIPAYDDEDVIAGQGTVGLEIMQDLPDVDAIIVPVGGGGLIAGTAVAVKELSPVVEIIGVQAAASPSAFLSLRDGKPYDPYEHDNTIADGLAGGFGAKPFYLARSLIERVELYDEESLRRSIFTLLDEDRVVAEASGAIAVAPLLEPDERWMGKRVIAVISGSNLETDLLRQILNEYR